MLLPARKWPLSVLSNSAHYPLPFYFYISSRSEDIKDKRERGLQISIQPKDFSMKIVSGNTKKHIRVKHDDFDSYLDYVFNTPVKAGNGRDSKNADATERWDFGVGWDGAVELASKGWEQGVKNMNKYRELVDVPEHTDRGMHMRSFNDLSGDEVDVGLYLSGEPECMTDYRLQLTPSYGKVANIVVNLSTSCSVSAKTMSLRGSAACILIDALEGAGVRCEVTLVTLCCQHITSEVVVKKPDEHMEPDRMAFMLAHPATFRRFGFKEMETFDGKVGQLTRNRTYGRPRNLPEKEREADGTIYFDCQYGGYHSEKEMVQSVNNLLAKYVDADLQAAA